jgi:adenylate cyclase class IV
MLVLEFINCAIAGMVISPCRLLSVRPWLGTLVEVEALSDDETSALMMISEIEIKLGLDSMEIVTRPYRDICMGY